MTDLRNLDEHNKSALDTNRLMTAGHPNGIACPKCGAEMWDTNPSVMLTSWPPRYSIHCPECGHTTIRY